MTSEQVIKPNWERVSILFWTLLVFVLVVLATACAPRMCKRVPIVITSHPTKPKPAGRVTVGCDGEIVSEILADEVLP
jgi:hypothetical protein